MAKRHASTTSGNGMSDSEMLRKPCLASKGFAGTLSIASILRFESDMKQILKTALLVGMTGAGFSASAQAIDPTIVIQTLGPGRDGPVVTALRQQNALNINPRQMITSQFDFAAMNVRVKFDGDSALLTTDGMLALRSVAAAMTHPQLQGQIFQVGAHAWSPNDPGGAIGVSTQRAQVVVDHLVAFYEIPAGRLVPVGYGSSKPVLPGLPGSPENIRIEFINITGL